MKNGRIREVVIPPIENKFTTPIKWAKTWEELWNLKGDYVDDDEINYIFTNLPVNKHIFATKEQAERYGIVAAQLSQLVAQLNGEPDWMPKIDEKFYYIAIGQDGLKWSDFTYNKFMILHFPLKMQSAAEFTIKHHADLWRKFYALS